MAFDWDLRVSDPRRGSRTKRKRRLPHPWRRYLGGIVLAGAGVFVGAHASTSEWLAPTRDLPGAIVATKQSWWQGFQDPALNGLIGCIRLQSPLLDADAQMAVQVAVDGMDVTLPLEMRVAAAYVLAKTDTIGLMLIAQARTSMLQQQALLSKPTRQASADRDALAKRLRDAEAARDVLAERQNAGLALIATACRLSPEALRLRLGDALTDGRLPHYAQPLPSRLPVSLLFNREDVSLAIALQGVDRETKVDGWITAQDGPAASMTREIPRGSADGYLDEVIARAYREVAHEMADLRLHSQRTQDLYEEVDATRQLLIDLEVQYAEGSVSELEMLVHDEQLMERAQQLSSESGELALAWIKLWYQLGGTGSLSPDTSALTLKDAGHPSPAMARQAGE